MNKSVVYLTVIAMLFAAVLSGTAFAQTETVTEVNWEDVSAAVEEAGISGDFYNVSDTGLRMWIPDVFSEVELTEEDVEDGLIAYLMPADESAAISVSHAYIEELTVDGYYNLLTETEGVEELEYVVINGIAAVSYKLPEQDTMTVSFVDDAGYVYEFTFGPASDEGFLSVATLIAASIQTVED